MARSVGALTAVLLALAGPASAATPEKAPSIITNPDWVDKPTGSDFEALFPRVAAFLRVEGQAVIRCRVDVSGLLSRCVVQQEKPANLGFGAATLAAAPYFKMRPKLIDGAPVSGGIVTIPMNWRLAPPTPLHGSFDVGNALRRGFPMEWQSMVNRLLAGPTVDEWALASEMQALRAYIFKTYSRKALDAPPASAKQGLDAHALLLTSLRSRPTLCLRAARGEPVPPEPSFAQVSARLMVTSINIMASARDHPTPHGHMTAADLQALRNGVDDRNLEVWDAFMAGRDGLMSAGAVCDGLIAIYQAGSRLPDETAARFWRDHLEWVLSKGANPPPATPAPSGPAR